MRTAQAVIAVEGIDAGVETHHVVTLDTTRKMLSDYPLLMTLFSGSEVRGY